ncbi:MAG TPA: twin-arginine translocase TatA/TatE family subunit [Candidatus Paceibacterota bacterium]|nr:twin-arginine translocase TatA/TatE family subunit [Candidatus Paceibacterota bacterium]
MFDIGIPELIVIGLAVAVLFFGSGKILDFARSLGKVSGEFKKGKADIEKELRSASDDSAQNDVAKKS